ncbi:MAG: T9SS type A sorting domain-containing protein [Bacteroidota bacterium]|nr:T9SS type A sorting domain-containing protein [Bacteroidota bacterium]
MVKGNNNAEALIPTEKNISVYPNPFNPTTTFRVSLPQAGFARLAVYNMLGQKVATVVDGEMPAGYNDVRFDGSTLSSGMYLYRLEMEKYVRSGKILLMK